MRSILGSPRSHAPPRVMTVRFRTPINPQVATCVSPSGHLVLFLSYLTGCRIGPHQLHAKVARNLPLRCHLGSATCQSDNARRPTWTIPPLPQSFENCNENAHLVEHTHLTAPSTPLSPRGAERNAKFPRRTRLKPVVKKDAFLNPSKKHQTFRMSRPSHRKKCCWCPS